MEPITWDWIATQQTKSIREWNALKESMQPHLDSLRKYLELPERRILYQVDDAIRSDILAAVRGSVEHELSAITVQLGAHWAYPEPGKPWMNPWSDRKFLVEGFCTLPAFTALLNGGHRDFPQYREWYWSEISSMIAGEWEEWIHKMLPGDIRAINVKWDIRHRPGNGFVSDLEYSIHVEFSRPASIPSLYEPLAPVKGRED